MEQIYLNNLVIFGGTKSIGDITMRCKYFIEQTLK